METVCGGNAGVPKIARERWLDITKGLAILLVILGHCDIPKWLIIWIYSFHMPFFFIIAGITFKLQAPAEPRDWFRKKTKRLLLPYIWFSFLLLSYKAVKLLIFHTPFSPLIGVISIVIPISGYSSSTVYSLWFLPTLFITEVLLLTVLCAKRNIQRVVLIIIYCTIIIVCYLFIPAISILNVLPFAVGFILLGAYANQWLRKGVSFWVFLTAAAINVLTCVINYQLHPMIPDLSSLNIGFFPLYIASGTSGTILFIYIAQKIKHCRILEYFGKNSLQYYGYHYLPNGLIKSFIPIGALQFALTMSCTYVITTFFAWIKQLLKKEKIK